MARKRAVYGTSPPSVHDRYANALRLWDMACEIQGPKLSGPSAEISFQVQGQGAEDISIHVQECEFRLRRVGDR